MAAIPILKPKGVVKAFERLGWEVDRQRCSHIVPYSGYSELKEQFGNEYPKDNNDFFGLIFPFNH
ncbi:MAG: hypothetical protein FJ134_09735 [Deltaproteobacteria bacterium]|nr:hypothetical protein [Deltaproteobacteria bacterium]